MLDMFSTIFVVVTSAHIERAIFFYAYYKSYQRARLLGDKACEQSVTPHLFLQKFQGRTARRARRRLRFQSTFTDIFHTNKVSNTHDSRALMSRQKTVVEL